MRKVASLEDIQKAEIFRWYLISQNIETKIEEDGETSLDVWIFKDQDWQKALEFYERFKTAEDLSLFEKSAEAIRKTWRPLIQEKKAESSHRTIAIGHAPYGTYTLMALSAVFFLMHFLDKDRWLMRHLMISEDMLASSLGIKSFRELFSGQIWRVYTPIFIHTDFFHIAFNMLWLYQFGRSVEEALGTFRFLFLTLFLAIPANIVFYLVSGPFFGGMSGVVYGLFFYMWATERYSLQTPYRMEPQLFTFFIVFYVVCWVLSVVGMHIANSIHGVGALCGVIAAYVGSGHWKRVRFRFDKLQIYNILIVVALIAGGIVTDYLTR